jgi:hypothetical protein
MLVAHAPRRPLTAARAPSRARVAVRPMARLFGGGAYCAVDCGLMADANLRRLRARERDISDARTPPPSLSVALPTRAPPPLLTAAPPPPTPKQTDSKASTTASPSSNTAAAPAPPTPEAAYDAAADALAAESSYALPPPPPPPEAYAAAYPPAYPGQPALAQQQQQQPLTPQQQAYYQAYPPPPPPLPYYPPAGAAGAPAASGPAALTSAIPWWVWMGAGILVANVLRFAQDVMKKGPQAMMAEMAMKQMMKGMPGAAGGGMPGGGGGMMPGGMPGGGGAPPSPFGPYGTANPFAPGFKPPQAPGAVDTTAAPVSKPAGEKFAARKDGGGGDNGASSSGGSKAAGDDGSKASTSSSSKPLDVVEAASVKEPESAKASAGPAAGSFFTDVGGAGAGAGAAGAGAGAAGAGGAAADPTRMTAMMEKMLRDPNMQKLLYPYLPEPMRNESSIEWMLSNPQVRAQMEQVFAQQGAGMSPELMEMMSQVDFSQDKVQAQFSQLGLDPQQVMQMVMNDPQLAAGFANPKVQRAVFEISQDPNSAAKYQDDPEVLAVLEKVTALFAPQMAAAGGAPPVMGMPQAPPAAGSPAPSSSPGN